MSSATATAAIEPDEEVADATSSTKLLCDDSDFIKPDPDNRLYRAILLPNGLKCLLVSSPESDVEAASIHVQAGHMDDPDNRAGLAHFHEHMLFLGTQKYPDESEYEAFLSQHGGSSNAYTDMEDTNYYFSVTPTTETDTSTTSTALAGGLDRLAQFFIAPKFDVSMVDRELRAIDSEYRNSLTNDAWRNYQLLKASASPLHPFSKFGCGNYNTLTQGGNIVNATHSVDIGSLPVQDLWDFWNKYYRTYNMRLAVVGRSSLDSLQTTVEETFGSLEKSDGAPRRSKKSKESDDKLFPMENSQYGDAPPAFGRDQLGKIRHVVPLIESRAIKVYFATPPLDDDSLKQSRPYRVISHLLGHESPGSLHALLNEEGLLTGLSSGIGIDTSDFSLFSLTIALTPEGMARKDYILSLVFQWIALIRQSDAMQSYHEELRQISETNFKFRENGDPTDFCSRAAELLFNEESPSNLLYGSVATGEYDADIALAFLDRLTPEHAMITILDPDFNTTSGNEDWQTEQWYGAQYQVLDMTNEQISEWTNPESVDARLQLPALNKYIPTDFTLRCEGDEDADVGAVSATLLKDDDDDEDDHFDTVTPPQVIVKRPDMRMWHKLDRKWKVPKTFLKISLLSPNVYRSPRTMTLNRIYERILTDDLNSFIYDATVAGCNYRVSCAPSGLRISLRGYSEKLPFLLDTLTTRMLSLMEELKQGTSTSLALKFKKAHDNLLRETKNYRLDTPYEACNYNARLVMEESVWYVDNYISELEAQNNPLTMKECGQVVQECLQGRLHAEALCIGNINQEEALQVADVVERHFLKSPPLLDVEVPTFRSMKLPTLQEAQHIFGASVSTTYPTIYQQVAYSESEENNAIELVLQAGCDFTLGYSGVALLDLISHLAYNSAYNQLRTKEQLGYIVSAFVRKVAGGAWSLSIIIQSSVALPSVLEERSEAWLQSFRTELQDISLEELEQEADAVVAQLMERDTKLSQEVNTLWGEIISSQPRIYDDQPPVFDRVERIAQVLKEKTPQELKEHLLTLFDTFFAPSAPDRRAMSLRVYNQKARAEFDENVHQPGVMSSYEDIAQFKSCLGTYPMAPYWRSKQFSSSPTSTN